LLSEAEQRELQETLPAALEDDFRYLDEYLWSRQRAVASDPDSLDERPVWSDLDEDEIAALTRILLRSGRHNPTMAAIARGAVNSRDYIVTVAIVAPRVKRTFDIVRRTHRPPKKRGQE
jgi:hypothetical protein